MKDQLLPSQGLPCRGCGGKRNDRYDPLCTKCWGRVGREDEIVPGADVICSEWTACRGKVDCLEDDGFTAKVIRPKGGEITVPVANLIAVKPAPKNFKE